MADDMDDHKKIINIRHTNCSEFFLKEILTKFSLAYTTDAIWAVSLNDVPLAVVDNKENIVWSLWDNIDLSDNNRCYFYHYLINGVGYRQLPSQFINNNRG